MTYYQKQELFNKLQPFFKLNDKWHDLVLGGSLALMLQEKLPYRNTGDIDLVGHRYHHFEGQVIHHLGTSVDDADCVMIEIDGVRYDYFIKPTLIYKPVELRGIIVNVQYPAQIIEAKMRYYNKYGVVKHRDDIISYLDINKNGYKSDATPMPAPSVADDDDLPF